MRRGGLGIRTLGTAAVVFAMKYAHDIAQDGEAVFVSELYDKIVTAQLATDHPPTYGLVFTLLEELSRSGMLSRDLDDTSSRAAARRCYTLTDAGRQFLEAAILPKFKVKEPL